MTNSPLPSLFENKDKPIFQSLQKEVDRVFDEFRDITPWNDEGFFTKSNGKLIPKLDLSETDRHVEISTELPGVKTEDIDISAIDNVLSIKGEKSSETKKEEKDYHMVERSFGSFSRTIPLGFVIDEKNVTAELKDGVLTIEIKKPAEVAAKTKKIMISKAV
jgi:HSP20 family protein